MNFIKSLRDIIVRPSKDVEKIIWIQNHIYLIVDDIDDIYYVESEDGDEIYGIDKDNMELDFEIFTCHQKLKKECNFCKYLKNENGLVECCLQETGKV